MTWLGGLCPACVKPPVSKDIVIHFVVTVGKVDRLTGSGCILETVASLQEQIAL